MTAPQTPARAFWLALCRRTARRRNAAALALPAAAGFAWMCAGAAVLILLWRMVGAAGRGPLNPLWIALLPPAAALAAWAGAALLQRRSGARWEVKTAAAFLDERLGLNAALSAALEGARGWPDPVSFHDPPPRLAPLLPPALCGALFITLASLLPLPSGLGLNSAGGAAAPPAVERIENLLGQLSSLEISDRDQIAAFRERLEQLAAQAGRDSWDHARVEALDRLEAEITRQTEAASLALRQLAEAARALRNPPPEQDNPGQPQPATAAENPANGGLPQTGGETGRQLRQELLEAIEKLGASEVPLDRETLAKLRESLGESGAPGADDALLDKLEDEAARLSKLASGRQGGGADGGGERDAEARGFGGVSRGPGEAPLDFTNKTEGAAADLERLASAGGLPVPGEMLGTTDSAPQADAAASGSGSAGGLPGPGEAPAAAPPPPSLTPAEREVMRRFFD